MRACSHMRPHRAVDSMWGGASPVRVQMWAQLYSMAWDGANGTYTPRRFAHSLIARRVVQKLSTFGTFFRDRTVRPPPALRHCMLWDSFAGARV